MPYEYRNVRWLDDHRIDVDLNHPIFGWVPCTLAEHDPWTAEWFADVAAENPRQI